MACSSNFPGGLLPFGNGPDSFNRVKQAVEIMVSAYCQSCVANLSSAVLEADYFDTGFGEVVPDGCDRLTVYITDGQNEIYEAIVLDPDASDPLDRITNWFLIYTESAVDGTITGEMRMYAGSSAPVGWLLCDGSEVSRATYSTLFALISTTYGVGNGTTTFNIPDMRARVPMGVNNGGLPNGANGTFTTRNLAATGGSETHTLILAETPAHTHTISKRDGIGNVNSSVESDNIAASFPTQATSSAGSDGSHTNTQPFEVVNFIIKT
jgi:microcystin-dependent protein